MTEKGTDVVVFAFTNRPVRIVWIQRNGVVLREQVVAYDGEPEVCGVQGIPPEAYELRTCELRAWHTGYHREGSVIWLGYFPDAPEDGETS